MKPPFLFRALALALGLWAPAQTAAAQAAPPASPTPAPVVQWWLQDDAADRVPGISAERAYRELLAGKEPKRQVVVAIIDSGIDIAHEDLDDNLWVNEGEIPGNGKDDDGNGYVDDVHGWNFIGGADGRHINEDTYEVTRLHAVCQARFDGVRADTLSAALRAEHEECAEIRTAFEKKRAELEEMLRQYRGMETVVQQVASILRRELGEDSLTVEKVEALRSPRQDVSRARSIYLELAAAGVTPEQITEGRESLEKQVEYGFNPGFDPRSIVGDNPDDLTEQGYGNADVTGPDASHGTHVAGISAAERGNALGIDGVAPSARIMVIRAVPNGDERDKDVANAIRYAVDNGAHVINMSFGKSHSPHKRVVDDAVRYAESKGVLLVHAAGNDGADLEVAPNFPNRYFEGGGEAGLWIEVGASSPSADTLAAVFSNYGKGKVDVFAPGVAILSSVPGSRYESNQGTSMAAPVVSGLAALLMAYYPELSAAEVRQVILDSTTRYADRKVLRPGSEGEKVRFGDLSATGGVVNAYAALKLAEERSAAKRN